MSDIESVPTVAALWERVQRLEDELEQRTGSKRRLLSSDRAASNLGSVAKPRGRQRLSRSRLLKGAAAGIAGLAAAELAGTLRSEPAAASGSVDTNFFADGGSNIAFQVDYGADVTSSQYAGGGKFYGQYRGIDAMTDGSHAGDLAVYAAARVHWDSAPPTPADGKPYSNIAVYGITNGGAAIVGQTSDAQTTTTPLNVGVYALTNSGYGVIGDARDGSSNLSTGTGVLGTSGSGTGVYGFSNTGDGVFGTSVGNGVHGQTTGPLQSGVWGEATGTGNGVVGSSLLGVGVTGNGGSNGVVGTTSSQNSAAIWGDHFTGGPGVKGTSANGEGVWGVGGTNGVHGTSSSASNSGVWGENTGAGYGVAGSSHTGTGMWGSSTGGVGILGTSIDRYGGQFDGVAPLYLVPNDYPGPPGTLGSGQYDKGALYTDYYGSLYACTASGNPGSWQRLSSVIPITPVRVLNTRPSKQIGPYKGPMASNTVLTVTLAGTNGIAANATGVIGNITAADATGGCFLAVVPSGANHSGVSTVNFPAQAQGTGLANAFTVGLAGGKIDIYTGNCSSYTVNIIVDITGYIV